MTTTFQTFLGRIASKIGAKNAFDLSRDAQLQALKKLLISKGITTEDEFNKFGNEELNRVASQIESMPPLPSPK